VTGPGGAYCGQRINEHPAHRAGKQNTPDARPLHRRRPLGKWGKAWGIATLFVAPVFVYYTFTSDEPLSWDLFVLCLMLAGMATVLSRLWRRRRRLAYGLQATGALVFQVGMIAFIASFGIRGEWGIFGYALFVCVVIALLTASGALYPDSSTRDGQREERS